MNASQLIKKSFTAFGGWKGILSSRYLFLSGLFTLLMFPYWIQDNSWELPIQIMPSIIGFTLAGFAILLAFGDTEFLKKLSYRENENHSPFYKFSSTFLIFIIVQTVTLILSILTKSWFEKSMQNKVMSLTSNYSWLAECYFITKLLFHTLTFFIFNYSLLLVIAAGVEIFRIVSWLEDYHTIEHNKSRIKQDIQDSSTDKV